MEQDNPARQAAIEMAVSIMEWEGAPLEGDNPTLNPDLAEVEVGSDPDSHPLRKGRIRPVTDPVLRGTEELAMVTGRIELLNHLK